MTARLVFISYRVFAGASIPVNDQSWWIVDEQTDDCNDDDTCV